MREWWANVYNYREGPQLGARFPTRAQTSAANGGAACRIHVRLKPEGAPRRYASEGEKRAWELDPAGAAFARRCGKILTYHGPDNPAGGGLVVQNLR